jgi:hypothetical protein
MKNVKSLINIFYTYIVQAVTSHNNGKGHFTKLLSNTTLGMGNKWLKDGGGGGDKVIFLHNCKVAVMNRLNILPTAGLLMTGKGSITSVLFPHPYFS